MAILILGDVVVTRGVYDLIVSDEKFKDFVANSLSRYISYDWGDLDDEDRQQNNEALESGEARILAAYIHPFHEDWRIWIITEWDRSVTTILFPSEY